MMERPYTVRPIEVWPGELTQGRVQSPFSGEWVRTVELLRHELDQIGARNVVLQMAVTEADVLHDGRLRARVKPIHPGVILSFESRYGPLQYVCDRFDSWQSNVRAIALGLESLRRVERYGITKRGQQYTGWKALPDKTMSREDAEDLLRSYGGEREAVRATHPDHGGNRVEFERVMAARRLLNGAGKE